MNTLALVLLLAAPAAAAPVRPERVVIRTTAGDVAIALYKGAPRHAEKLLKLFASGAYDGSALAKLDATRFAAFSSAPNAPGAKRIPVETGGPAVAGAVMMAHQPSDPDAGETAFVVLFAAMPVMDGKFSAVGEVAAGRETLEALKAAPVDAESRPARPISILSTSVLPTQAALDKEPLRGPVAEALGGNDEAGRRNLLLGLAALLALSAGALWAFAPDLGKAARSVALLCGLGAFFLVFAAYVPRAASSPWISVPLLLSAVGVFKAMSYFEK
ncbi:MAG: peptidylprolyl isomerase [Elusimicrobiota bacterium]|nr:MAG: peptidylprolyl isomerase [Elusimicrobiota bacterium]